jgi:hypothetical protein
MHADLTGPGIKYVMQRSSHAPATPVLRINSSIDCPTNQQKVILDGSFSSHVSSHRYSVNTQAAAVFTSDWIKGSPGLVDISHHMMNTPELQYHITLEVQNENSKGSSSVTKSLYPDTCRNQANEISLQADNPVRQSLSFSITSEKSHIISVQVSRLDGSMNHVLLHNIEINKGVTTFSENAEWMEPGLYYISVYSAAGIIASLVIKPS